MSSRARGPGLAALAGALGLVLAYSNHFRNPFQFDDFHTIVENPAIRSLRGLPRIFGDASAFSTLPTHQVYRPWVTASLAIDHHLAGGLDPLAFHLSTFLWFAVLLCAIYGLALLTYRRAAPEDPVHVPALACALVFGLHPAAAQTINYVIQRAEVYCALGIVSGLVLYAAFPAQRRTGAYLLPVAAGALAKPPALIFPALLWAWVSLCEPAPVGRHWRALRAAVPAGLMCAGLGVLLAQMSGPGFAAGGGPALQYRLTQLPVAWHYFASFFAPLGLSADTDLRLVSGFADPRLWAGAAFLAALLGLAAVCARERYGRPIALGIAWFLLTLLPTSWMPLAEPANDHRMFLPFIGLSLAATWTAWRSVRASWERGPARTAWGLALIALLALEIAGTRARNAVWSSEESLWHEVTRKNPENGRGWMNYGLTQMAKGEYPAALESYARALELTPQYPLLHANLGIAKAALGRDDEAEAHFSRALALSGGDAQVTFYYARWLRDRGQPTESLTLLDAAAARAPASLPARKLRMELLASLREWSRLDREIEELLSLAPGDVDALRHRAQIREIESAVRTAEVQLAEEASPERWLDLSYRYYEAGRYRDSRAAARHALALRPDYAEAHNNLSAAHNSLGEWDEGIAAARRALELAPNFELARNNLAFATARRDAGASPHGAR